MRKFWFASMLAPLCSTASMAGNAPTTLPEANKPASTTAEYIPLGTASFGPNGHGSYAWFIEAKSKQVVMCLVHNPQAPIECKRVPIPAP